MAQEKKNVVSSQLNPGMMLTLSSKLYRVESCVKVTPTKGNAFIKVQLRDISTEKMSEKNFKPEQDLNIVSLSERNLEFLYPEGKQYCFMDIDNLDQVLVSNKIIQDKVNYLKEGVEVKATFYGDTPFTIELPQFLELMVIKILDESDSVPLSNSDKLAILETGAQIVVPTFIEIGDVIKIDTNTQEYIQRV